MAGPILVVSPHLDDAVLSLGGSIVCWRAAGTPVTIASVYSAGPPLDQVEPAMRKWADYATRCAEDDASCARLGVDVQRLGLIERAFRPPFLRGWSFFTTPAERSGFTALPDIVRGLEAISLVPASIYVPLGIGNHIDHVETALAATDWAIGRGWIDRLRFYEDFYGLSGVMRRRHFVAKRLIPRRSPLARSRRLRTILRRIAAQSSGPRIEQFLDPRLVGAHWTHTTQRPSIAAKLDAIACYTSQTAAFGGIAGIARAMRRYPETVWLPLLGSE